MSPRPIPVSARRAQAALASLWPANAGSIEATDAATLDSRALSFQTSRLATMWAIPLMVALGPAIIVAQTVPPRELIIDLTGAVWTRDESSHALRNGAVVT